MTRRAAGGTASAASHACGLSLELGVHGADGGEVVVGRLLQTRARVVVAHLGAEQAERRQHAGMARDDDRAHAEQRGEVGAVQRAGAAEGHQREVARVVAALDRHQPERADHVVVHDVEDALRRRLQREPERPGHPLLDGPPRPIDVERDLAAEQVRRDAAEHQVGVGDGGLLAAGAVADRARLRPRALGPHRQRAVRR